MGAGLDLHPDSGSRIVAILTMDKSKRRQEKEMQVFSSIGQLYFSGGGSAVSLTSRI